MCPGFESLSCYFFFLSIIMFLNTISKFIESEELKNCRIAVAVSGGADSVALLTALVAVSEKYELSLAVVHVNYQLRSEESEKDHLFVKSLAESHSVAFFPTLQDFILTLPVLKSRLVLSGITFLKKYRKSTDIPLSL